MRIIKSIFILVLVVTAIGAGLTLLAHRSPTGQLADLPFLPSPVRQALAQASSLLPAGNLDGNVLGVQTTALGAITSQTATIIGSHISNLGPIGGFLASNSGAVVSKDAPAATQRAFDYARYTYCQQVIRDYNQHYGTPSASPAPTPTGHMAPLPKVAPYTTSVTR